ncbi:HNH endonuclease [Aquamicrobium sp.]|uniref:HNH endonuclease n=1 Tax=Aquamicrobium sp. TaxID=1872579 RepID=UPI00349EB189
MPQNRILNQLAHERRRSKTVYPETNCVQCGGRFKPYNSKGCRYCSPECKRQHRKQKLAEQRVEVKKKCLHCESEFSTKTPQRKFCCTACVRKHLHRDVPENAERIEKKRAFQKAYSRTPSFRNSQRNAKARRRAAERSGDVITYEQWTAVVAKYGGRCVYCGQKPDKLTMDHVKHLAKGGEHKISNIVPACLSCNAAKGARDWSDRRCL